MRFNARAKLAAVQQQYGEKFRLLRKNAHLSQRDVGLALGYAPSSAQKAVSRFERGHRFPPAFCYRPLAILFGVSLSDVLPDVNPYDLCDLINAKPVR